MATPAKVLILALLCATPVVAQTPPILISGEERDRVLQHIQTLEEANERLGKALLNCRTAQRT